MKKQFLSIISAAVLLISCSTEPSREPFLFAVQVDSIAHAPSVLLNDTIIIKLYGTIGTNGCYSFSYFDDKLQPQRLDLTVVGERSASTVCTDVVVYLDGKEYRCVALQNGWFSINIRQPDESRLRDSVFVE
ncbi:MAG: hypothetical protein HYV29_11920 [Ignavibacteriales bacterium]|nr:hypothetical protein [Ignavibacteriales bacterium]